MPKLSQIDQIEGTLTMAKSPPSFDFYYNDWIGGVQDLSPECERHYLRLLIYQWQNGEIPKSKIAQMNVCGITDVGKWDSVWAQIAHKFAPFDGENGVFFAQARMKEDRERSIPKWLHNKEIRSAAGRLGGRPKSKTKAKRKQNESKTKATEKQTWKEEGGSVFDTSHSSFHSFTTDPSHCAQSSFVAQSSDTSLGAQTTFIAQNEQSEDLSSAIPQKQKNSETAQTATVSFDQFWASYPMVASRDGRTVPKGNRAAAEARWMKMRADDRQAAVEAIPLLREYLVAHSQCNQHAATWLNQRGWLTDYAEQVEAIATAERAAPQAGVAVGSEMRPDGKPRFIRRADGVIEDTVMMEQIFGKKQ